MGNGGVLGAHVDVEQVRKNRSDILRWLLGCSHRSQESLLKAPVPGLYRSESQLYPHVVLQRVATPTAPSAPLAPTAPLYLHLPSTASSPAHVQHHMVPGYPAPTYPPNPNAAAPAFPHPTAAPIYPNPNPAPQRPWQ